MVSSPQMSRKQRAMATDWRVRHKLPPYTVVSASDELEK